MDKVRIVLADDHPVVIDGLSRYFALQSDLVVLATAHNRAALVQAIALHRPQVVVVDLSMPGMTGEETIRTLANAEGAPRIIVFSMQEEDAYAQSLVRAGAAAFLNKSRPPEMLANTIRAAASGNSAPTEMLAPHEAFSKREREVFNRLVDGQTLKAIAFDLGLQVSTVHTYCERIRDKLGVDSLQGVVSYAFTHHLR